MKVLRIVEAAIVVVFLLFLIVNLGNSFDHSFTMDSILNR
jgi:hypothetical protein